MRTTKKYATKASGGSEETLSATGTSVRGRAALSNVCSTYQTKASGERRVVSNAAKPQALSCLPSYKYMQLCALTCGTRRSAAALLGATRPTMRPVSAAAAEAETKGRSMQYDAHGIEIPKRR